MNLQEALAKESFGEEELKVINAHRAELSDADLIRLGFKQPEPAEEINPSEDAPVVEKPKRTKKVV